MNNYKVGDGVQWKEGANITCGTVVKVTGKTVHVVEDNASRVEASPNGDGVVFFDFTPGNGCVIKFTYRSRKDEHKMAGTSLAGSMAEWGYLRNGRHKFIANYY